MHFGAYLAALQGAQPLSSDSTQAAARPHPKHCAVNRAAWASGAGAENEPSSVLCLRWETLRRP